MKVKLKFELKNRSSSRKPCAWHNVPLVMGSSDDKFAKVSGRPTIMISKSLTARFINSILCWDWVRILLVNAMMYMKMRLDSRDTQPTILYRDTCSTGSTTRTRGPGLNVELIIVVVLEGEVKYID